MKIALFNTLFTVHEKFETDDTSIWQSSITRIGSMFCIAWSIKKGDWWKSKEEAQAKFFSMSWKKPVGKGFQTGVFIGRLAIVLHQKPHNKDLI